MIVWWTSREELEAKLSFLEWENRVEASSPVDRMSHPYWLIKYYASIWSMSILRRRYPFDCNRFHRDVCSFARRRHRRWFRGHSWSFHWNNRRETDWWSPISCRSRNALENTWIDHQICLENTGRWGEGMERSSYEPPTCHSSALIDVGEDRIGYVERQPADGKKENDQKKKNIVSSLSTHLMTQSMDIVTFNQEPIAKTWKKSKRTPISRWSSDEVSLDHDFLRCWQRS